MAFLYIFESPRQGRDAAGLPLPSVEFPALAVQKLAIGTEVKSAAFHTEMKILALNCDVACHIDFGPTVATATDAVPVATTSHFRLSPNQTIFWSPRTKATGWQLSVIAGT